MKRRHLLASLLAPMAPLLSSGDEFRRQYPYMLSQKQLRDAVEKLTLRVRFYIVDAGSVEWATRPKQIQVGVSTHRHLQWVGSNVFDEGDMEQANDIWAATKDITRQNLWSLIKTLDFPPATHECDCRNGYMTVKTELGYRVSPCPNPLCEELDRWGDHRPNFAIKIEGDDLVGFREFLNQQQP